MGRPDPGPAATSGTTARPESPRGGGPRQPASRLPERLGQAWFESRDVRALRAVLRPALERLGAGMPAEQVRCWIGALHPLVAVTPRLAATAFACCEDRVGRRLIARNLVDELAGEDHLSLYERSLRALGVPLERIRQPQECPGERELQEELRSALRGGTALEAVVALHFGVEQGFATFCRAVVAGLERLPAGEMASREEALRYWEVHAEADREHVAANRALIGILARDCPEELEQRLFAQVARIAGAKLRAVVDRMTAAHVMTPVGLPVSPTGSPPSADRPAPTDPAAVVRRLIAGRATTAAGADRIDDATLLMEGGLGLDSVAVAELLLQLEELLGLPFPSELLAEEPLTVGSLVAHASERPAAATRGARAPGSGSPAGSDGAG